jgi:hypothetical protein
MTNLFEDYEIAYMSELYTEDMIKKDDIECCVCYENHWGVKLPNCDHFICPKCYYKIYHHGYLSSEFINENSKPVGPERPKEPLYPFIPENLEVIYNELTNNDKYESWFILSNEELYDHIVFNDYKSKIDRNIINWFQTNNELKIYEEDKNKYKLAYKEYQTNHDIFCEEIEEYRCREEEERQQNCSKLCPLCRR